jgi:hypothetical protein
LRFDQNPGMAPSLNDCSGTFKGEGGKKSVLSHTVESGDTGGRKAFASMSDVSIRTLRSATSQKTGLNDQGRLIRIFHFGARKNRQRACFCRKRLRLDGSNLM